MSAMRHATPRAPCTQATARGVMLCQMVTSSVVAREAPTATLDGWSCPCASVTRQPPVVHVPPHVHAAESAPASLPRAVELRVVAELVVEVTLDDGVAEPPVVLELEGATLELVVGVEFEGIVLELDGVVPNVLIALVLELLAAGVPEPLLVELVGEAVSPPQEDAESAARATSEASVVTLRSWAGKQGMSGLYGPVRGRATRAAPLTDGERRRALRR